MDDLLRSKVIKDNPIGSVLDVFRASFVSTCESEGVAYSANAIDQLGREGLRNLTLLLLSSLQSLSAAGLLQSKAGRGTLRADLLKLIAAVTSDDFNFDRIKPLLRQTLADETDEILLWKQVYNAVTEATPPPRPTASSLQQTPWLRNTSSFPNSSEHRKYVDDVLKEELGSMYVGLRDFHDTYFGGVINLETASKAFFDQCIQGSGPKFEDGWEGWPKDANQDDVLSWFAGFSEKLAAFADGQQSSPTRRCGKRPLTKPNKPIHGSVGRRKMDIGFMSAQAQENPTSHWSHVLVPGELKSNPSADKASEAWLDLGRYAREVLATQDARRFTLGFTICGSLMRVWAFDRVGGIASEQFDINKDGRRFVFTVLGFLWMSDEELGFDSTIVTANHERFIEIKRNGSRERIIIDEVMLRARCIAGRATTCWKAHPEGHPETVLIIKDSWQYTERDDEGDLLSEVTEKGATNVARHYHHQTVQIREMDDDIQNNVRRGLDITAATNYRPGCTVPPSDVPTTHTPRKGCSSSSRKRPSSQTDSPLPPSKRSSSVSPTKPAAGLPNRVHRRVILRDYGKPIYKASSRSALLAALAGCVDGHESLYKAGILHRDISIYNLMINEDRDNPSWPSFLIDLDLAIRTGRGGASGAKGKTGTRAFMAIGALLGEQHSFMHDLESFFWVLFWTCIHYNGPDKGRVVQEFDKWNYVDMKELAKLKLGTVAKEGMFMETATDHFTPYYKPLIPWVNRLRRQVFPMDKPWEREDMGLYSVFRTNLLDAQEDPKVLGTCVG
ncbi:mRNA export factor rsm1 [Verticillium dahliae VDG2]|nr:mRNA export factor rsm1 [Verticillium dahliae VDG2]